MSLWWRAECGSIDHPKLLKLSDAMHRAWYTLMCVAGANGGALPPTEDIAIRLRMNKAKVAEWITKLVQAELFDNVDGVFVPHNWTKRQYKSDKTDPTASERMKRYRRNKRNGVTVVTDGNDSNQLHTEAEAQPNPKSEQSTAEARELDEMGLKQEGMLRAAFTAECSGRAVFPDMSIIKTWLLAGIALATISNTVTPILRRKQDMKSLVYCDAAVREAHSKAAPQGLQVVVDMSGWVVVIEGTLEETCWQQHTRETTGRPMFICDVMHEGRMVRGIKKPTPFPPGFNDFGERIPPSAEDAA
ncbi:hypothetical protein RPMA_12365 [Tardiphaga alba]|uniref:Helix-turn-helix protein n=1 Tax=Tardiphaga alba TaxID=340268 RepID=A0ABX8A723_9BRAD|nr:hypothetical protein [Tardiphaga alba]QUS39541.1 hypothetical protein RPMA_12365 [Tardiphaga alba]